MLALLIPGAFAFAQSPAIALNTNVSGTATTSDQRSATGTSASVDAGVNASATGTQAREVHASTTANSKAEEHRSAVATFVASLLSSADRDGGIGDEVRAVAQSQNDSASTTVEAMTQIEGRSKIKTFFLGSDWKNLGTLRSQTVKGSADITRLESARDNTSDATIRANLSVQIDALKAEQAKIQTFVDTHASSFSLFGWFTKLFAGGSKE